MLQNRAEGRGERIGAIILISEFPELEFHPVNQLLRLEHPFP
jgi:hypothetical protein